MTHTSTEQERAEFESAFIEQKLMELGISGDVAEKDLREVFLWKDAAGCYDHKETKAALWGWQAARRAPVVPQDPMDWPLPCDVTVGHGTVGKGVKLRTLVLRMKALYKVATGNDADEVAARTPEQRATLLAAFQSQIAAAPQPPEQIQPKVCKTEIQTIGCTDHIEQHLETVAAPETAHATVQAAVHPNLGTYHRVMAKRAATAAPVQLPEPSGLFSYGAKDTRPTYHHGCFDKDRVNQTLDECVTGGPHRCEFAYAEPQVRQLLASTNKPE